jgi:hypothetical protein
VNEGYDMPRAEGRKEISMKPLFSVALLPTLALVVGVLILHAFTRGHLTETCITSDGSLDRGLSIANEASGIEWMHRAEAHMPMSQCVWEWHSAPGFWRVLL